MNVSLPYPTERYNEERSRQLVDQLTAMFSRVLSTETASPYALLTSPDGSVWKITVDNLGALKTAKLPLGVSIA
jgi:phenylpyruvate tautomerase PptA (4-oxalocrotonate tautomerase family)